jgi:hypothetical protein
MKFITMASIVGLVIWRLIERAIRPGLSWWPEFGVIVVFVVHGLYYERSVLDVLGMIAVALVTFLVLRLVAAKKR